jgi:hypothetical protein
MGERRINPETGVVEEDSSLFNGAFGRDWQPATNDQGRVERVNPETGVHEEDHSAFGGTFGYDFEPATNDQGNVERVNPETGIHETDHSVFGGTFGYDFEPATNDQGNVERVNPETGIHEADHSVFGGTFGYDFKPATNDQGNVERVNPETGIHEEDRSVFGGTFGYDWQAKHAETESMASRGFPRRRHISETERVRQGHRGSLGAGEPGNAPYYDSYYGGDTTGRSFGPNFGAHSNRTLAKPALWLWILGGVTVVSFVGATLMILVFAVGGISNQNKNANLSNLNSRISSLNAGNKRLLNTRASEPGRILFNSQGTWRAINMINGLRGDAGQDAGFYYGYFEYLNFAESQRGQTLIVEVKSQYIPARIEVWRGNISGDDHAWWTHYEQAASSSEGTVFEQKPQLRWVITPGNHTLFFAAFSHSGDVSNVPFFAKLDIGPGNVQGLDSDPTADRQDGDELAGTSRSPESRPLLVIPQTELQAPNLIDPIDGATLPQPDAGEWHFDWEDIPTVERYEIVVQGLAASFPVLHTETRLSQYTIPRKDAYIADRHLLGWGWRVRAKTQNGQWGKWSPLRRFNVSPRNQ